MYCIFFLVSYLLKSFFMLIVVENLIKKKVCFVINMFFSEKKNPTINDKSVNELMPFVIRPDRFRLFLHTKQSKWIWTSWLLLISLSYRSTLSFFINSQDLMQLKILSFIAIKNLVVSRMHLIEADRIRYRLNIRNDNKKQVMKPCSVFQDEMFLTIMTDRIKSISMVILCELLLFWCVVKKVYVF